MDELGSGGLTPIRNFGEFRFIEHVTRGLSPKRKEVIRGVGDDAAVYDVGNGNVHLLTTDLLIEGIHFDLTYVPLRHLGYKSVVVNLSDIYAMNGEPFGITVSVAMSSRFTVEAMEEFYEGVKLACEKYQVDLLGGDTSSSVTGLLISVTAVGKGRAEDIVYRNGAALHDLVCVTGTLGGAYAGFQILEREKRVFLANPDIQPELQDRDFVIGRQLKPEARKDIIERLAAAKVRPSSMIDISDGLASELNHICKQSGVGAEIYEEKIPIDVETGFAAEEFNIPAITFALNGGEDYELLFTVGLEFYEQVNKMENVYIIGHITDAEDGVQLVNRHGAVYEIEAQGWNHFD